MNAEKITLGIFLWSIGSLTAWSQSATDEGAAVESGSLTFLNGDRLEGSMSRISGGGDPRLVWEHPGADQPISFILDGLDRVGMPYREMARGSNVNARLVLTNDDVLEGDLLGLDADFLHLGTWFSSTLKVERVMIRQFFPNLEVAGVLYEGPQSLDEWSFTGRGSASPWKFRSGKLYALQQMPISRSITNWPAQASIDFEVSWRSYPSFNFTMFGDETGQVMRSGYMVQVSGNSVYFRRYSPEQGTANMWNVNVPELSNNRYRSARIRLFIDRTKGAFTMMVNDEVIKSWTDPNGFVGQGDAIQFRPLSLNGFSISNIRVSSWNGVVPNFDKSARNQEEDFVQFVNRDSVEGAFVSISDGVAKFKGEDLELDIPLERISDVEFAPEMTERARRNARDVRAILHGGLVVTVKLDSLEEGLLRGSSENFGDAVIPLSAIRQLDFNIYTRRENEEPEEGDE